VDGSFNVEQIYHNVKMASSEVLSVASLSRSLWYL